jgi:phospholipid/cholesterol/gamma-HCH transport system ATP-binding protein
MATHDAVVVEDIHTQFGKQQVHKGVSFTLGKGSLTAIIGGSGTGKSVLLREIVGLQRPNSGSIRVLGTDMWADTEANIAAVKKRFGMMFQDGALFSALSVQQNVLVPLVEHADIPPALLHPLVNLRLSQAGLTPDVGLKMPSQLSGGMRKRAALARALALEPEILFLDEPTSGLDPTTARSFDKLVRSLVDDLGISVLVVTHDLDTLLTVVDRIIVLADGKMLADGPVQDIVKLDHPWIQSYFAIRTMTESAHGS